MYSNCKKCFNHLHNSVKKYKLVFSFVLTLIMTLMLMSMCESNLEKWEMKVSNKVQVTQ